jgi:hypothetical protein
VEVSKRLVQLEFLNELDQLVEDFDGSEEDFSEKG